MRKSGDHGGWPGRGHLGHYGTPGWALEVGPSAQPTARPPPAAEWSARPACSAGKCGIRRLPCLIKLQDSAPMGRIGRSATLLVTTVQAQDRRARLIGLRITWGGGKATFTPHPQWHCRYSAGPRRLRLIRTGVTPPGRMVVHAHPPVFGEYGAGCNARCSYLATRLHLGGCKAFTTSASIMARCNYTGCDACCVISSKSTTGYCTCGEGG